MKKLFCFLLLVLTGCFASAQKKKTDSLKLIVNQTKTDTEKYEALHKLDVFLYSSAEHPDSAMILEQQAYLIAKKNKWLLNQGRSLNIIANIYELVGNYAMAIKTYLAAAKIFQDINNPVEISIVNNNLGDLYQDQGNTHKALLYYARSKKLLEAYSRTHQLSPKYQEFLISSFSNIGLAYRAQHMLDSADKYFKMALSLCKKFKINKESSIYTGLGEVSMQRKNYKEALHFYRLALLADTLNENKVILSSTYLDIADLYHQNKQQDSARFYAKKSLKVANEGHVELNEMNADSTLSQYYEENHNLPEAYKYFKRATAIKDTLFSQNNIKQTLSVDFEQKLNEQSLANDEVQYRDKVSIYILTGGLAVLFLLAVVFWRNSEHRKRANKLLDQQKREIEEQRDRTDKTLADLKLTQAQLIQSEKMASLGELTAGIAHEIQNPLNFVNNFSEVNHEMIDELREELKAGNIEEALIIANDIQQNEEKITHHGKRADGIVKGMLQHSRASTGVKEPIDINALADEYLRLAYHGLRAKDKSFNVELITRFDDLLPKVEAMPQDVGRVLLNIYNNAFYATQQKQKTTGADYEPTVEVSTTKTKGFVEVKVKDNGTGIPNEIKDKIMQPFFTTKSTGEGTGLGLSLSYDIIVKGHGGSISVETVEGEYSVFIIKLPL